MQLCHASSKSSGQVNDFRKKEKIPGVTIVHDKRSANRALKELHRLQGQPHAWDTEATGVGGIAHGDWRSPVTHGRVLCATCFCGDDADFGNGPRLLIDNDGPAEGLLQHFKDYFEDVEFKKVFHNYSFDRHLLARQDIQVRGFHADTLHMARLFDTSLAAWEGKAARDGGTRIAAPQEEQQQEDVLERPRARLPLPDRVAVQNVFLGGKILPQKSWSLGASMLHTSCLSTSSSNARLDEQVVPGGYALKELTRYYGLSDKRQRSFSELFGTHATAAEDAHNSKEGFSDWVDYATDDAVLTHRLFEYLHKELVARPWCSPVHERPIAELQRDKNIVRALLKQRSAYDSAPQYRSGRSMWEFYELYLREFGECLADLEKVGIGVDCSALERIEEAALRDCAKSHDEFVHAFGPAGASLVADAGQINVRSSKQLQTLLFGGAGKNNITGEQLGASESFPVSKREASNGARRFEIKGLGLQPVAKRKSFTGKGAPRTSADVLEELAGRGSSKKGLAYQQLVNRQDAAYSPEKAEMVAKGLQQLREAAKTKTLITGFAQPLQAYARPTGRIHPQWKFDTSTGRLACRKPNLQNLPAVQRDKYAVRSAFQAGTGNAFVIADYSQLELRVLAHVANCSSMIEKLTKGGDFHSEVAAEMFSHVAQAVSRREVVMKGGSRDVPTVKEKFAVERSKAKAVNFGIVYGQEPSTLAEDLDIEIQEAENLMQAWFDSKPAVRRWKNQLVRQCSSTQRALSLLGRWRNLPFIHSAAPPHWRRKSERAAVNFGIQGSSADVVMAAMLRIRRSAELQRLGFKLVLQVHDEFVLEGPEALAAEASELVRALMLEPFHLHQPSFRFRVPLVADIVVRRSFSD